MDRTPERVNQRVDEPTEAPAPLSRPLSRRNFVTKGLAVVGLGTAIPAAFVRVVTAEGVPPGVAAPRRVLVVLQLGGGNDGLNTVIPYADGAYFTARPRLAVNPEAALHLDDGLALHPAMGGIKALWDRGQVAIVQGAGYPSPNRSHFRAMEIWHTASTAEHERTGWLGRLLDATHHEQAALWRAANVGSSVPPSFMAQQSFVPSVSSVPTYTLAMDPAARGQHARRTADWVRLYAEQAALGGALALVSRTGTQAYESTLDLQREAAAYQPLATYPTNALGSALRTCAQIVTSSLGTSIAYVTTGGFDTHAGQANTQQNLLQGVSDAVAAFYADLAARQMEGHVLTMMWTEFGRRVRENGSAGTDHGTATPVFLFGGGVRGGIHGETPSLASLDQGDLKHTTDFRSVYATLLARWLQTDPRDVLQGSFPELGFL
jgi:uncharacterized protein (DUF1501 family)